MDLVKRNDCLKLFNQRGDLYSLLHNFDVQFIPFKLGIFKIILRREIKIKLKACTNPLFEEANYDLKRNNSRNV